MADKFIWSEKYAPKVLNDCVLTDSRRKFFENLVKSQNIPPLILHGDPGMGKTTMAWVLVNELNMVPLFINGSLDTGIDIVRNNIESFVSSRSLDGRKKIVILDEGDRGSDKAQAALKAFIEKYQNSCSFIITCNNLPKIDKALISRFTCIDFTLSPDEKVEVMKKTILRVMKILSIESVPVDKKALVELCKKYFPDIRKVLGELQRGFIQENEINFSALEDSQEDLDDLFRNMKIKQYTSVRKFCINTDTSSIYTRLYNELFSRLKPEDIPASIITLADYQYKHSFVSDRELNLLACLSEIMFNAEFI